MEIIKEKTKIDAHSIWISDIHLGSNGCKSARLLDFLNSINCNNLFLVGDIVDNWLVTKIQSLTNEQRDIIQKIRDLKDNGLNVVYLPGNHDNQLRKKTSFYNVPIKDELCYTSLKNKSYLILHGDQVDTSMYGKSRVLSFIGGWIYECCLTARKISEKFKKTNEKKSDFSRWLKVTIKNLFAKLTKYDQKLFSYISNKKVDGVICGHSHQPRIGFLSKKEYMNSGDWIDNCTSIIEDHSGAFRLIKWDVD